MRACLDESLEAANVLFELDVVWSELRRSLENLQTHLLLPEAIDQALKAEGPAIVYCVVPATELPNMPHMELGKIENFAKAKVKEAILAVTGG